MIDGVGCGYIDGPIVPLQLGLHSMRKRLLHSALHVSVPLKRSLYPFSQGTAWMDADRFNLDGTQAFVQQVSLALNCRDHCGYT